MIIDWEEYKEFKRYTVQTDKFRILIDFLKNYHRVSVVSDIYDVLQEDTVGLMMLKKKEITNSDDLENFMFKNEDEK